MDYFGKNTQTISNAILLYSTENRYLLQTYFWKLTFHRCHALNTFLWKLSAAIGIIRFFVEALLFTLVQYNSMTNTSFSFNISTWYWFEMTYLEIRYLRYFSNRFYWNFIHQWRFVEYHKFSTSSSKFVNNGLFYSVFSLKVNRYIIL